MAIDSAQRWQERIPQLIEGMALFGVVTITGTIYVAVFISERPVFGLIYFAAPFLWCLFWSLLMGIYLSRKQAKTMVPFLTTIACLVLQKLNLHVRIYTEPGFDTVMMLGGDVLGVLVGWAIAVFVAKFRLVRRGTS
jgi:hypothetical protein